MSPYYELTTSLFGHGHCGKLGQRKIREDETAEVRENQRPPSLVKQFHISIFTNRGIAPKGRYHPNVSIN